MNEYTIDANGVTLNGGRTWQDADHLNVRTESGTTNFHAEAKCAAVPAPPECSTLMQAAASRIGESFIPWSDLGIDPESCIEWVQFSRANYHYGEAGEEPLCLTVTPEPEPVIPVGYVPEISKDCDGATWSHPATSTGAGIPTRYEISVNGGANQAYAPGEAVAVEWPEGGSTSVVSLFGYYEGGFWHQIGQSKFANDVECVVTPPQPANESRVVESEGAPDCESLTVPVTATREEAGYYLGDDGQWHLGEYVAVDAKVWNRPAGPDECPSVPAPKPGEPAVTSPVVDAVPSPAEVSTDAPVSARPVSDGLATTGADPTVGLVLALVAIVAGGSALLRKVVK